MLRLYIVFRQEFEINKNREIIAALNNWLITRARIISTLEQYEDTVHYYN